MTDCLLIGHNEGSFPDHVSLVRSMGTDSGAWRDLNLAFVDIDGIPYTSMDVLNRYNGREAPQDRYSNMDFLWPAITYLASYVGRRGFSVDYVNLFQREKERLRQKLSGGAVRAVAVTTTLYVAPWPIEEIVRFVRQCNPSVKIVLGGPFVHNQSQLLDPAQFARLLAQLDADVYVISQEGELALANVLACFKQKTPLAFVNNIAYREKGTYVRTTIAPESNSLADNMVDYSLFPSDQIGRFVSTRTSKSCPFACSVCGFPQRAGKYTFEDVATVERELEAIRRTGTVTTLTFIDDTFNVPMPRFKSILRMMIANRYESRWNSFMRADHVDDECIELMRESGCDGVFLGLQSGSDDMLKAMNKTSRSAHYRRVIPQLREAGIVTYCSLIVGFPGETTATVEQTMRLIDEAQPDFYRAQLWYCDPVTPVWKKREALGITGSGFAWKHPTMDAATAAQLIDGLFLQPRKPVWLQQGFELWSVFYLQRQGMTLAQIKAFLSAFNELVQVKLQPSRMSERESLLTQLALRSQFGAAAGASAA